MFSKNSIILLFWLLPVLSLAANHNSHGIAMHQKVMVKDRSMGEYEQEESPEFRSNISALEELVILGMRDEF